MTELPANYWHALHNLSKRVLGWLVVSILVCWHQVDWLYKLLEQPVLQYLPTAHLISIAITDTVLVPLQLSWYLGLSLTVPYLLFELWRFISPALTRVENLIFWPIILSSCGLFVLGGWFAYKIVIPIMFGFFSQLAPPNIEIVPDIMLYLQLFMQLIITFGVVAQLPLFMLVITWLRLVDIQFWLRFRPKAVLLAFIMGMLLTPPDVVSQVLLAVPLCFLYELGILLVRLIVRKT